MAHRIEQGEGYAVVHLDGEVDLSNSPAARKLIMSALQKPQGVLVDLSGVSYIDSSGIANLVEGYQLARQLGVDFALLGVSPAARKVLGLARLDEVFTQYRALEDWLAKAQPTDA